MAARQDQPVLRPLARTCLELLLVAAVAIGVTLALWRLRLVVLPTFVALLLTTLLLPLVRRLRDGLGVPSAAAAGLAMLATLGVLAIALVLLVPPVVDEVGQVGSSAREGLDEVTQWLSDGPLAIDPADVDRATDQAVDALRDNLGGIGRGVIGGATIAAEVVAGFLIALVLTFFFLHDGDRIWRWILSLVPQRHRRQVDGFGHDALAALGGYLRGVIFVALVDATFIGIGLAVLGVPLVLPLAVLTFVAAFVPLVGAVTAGAVAALVALVTEGVVDAVLVVVIVTAVQQLEGDLLYPVVVGRSIDLHPVATLLAVTGGGVLGGIAGAAVAVPVAAVVWTGVKRARDVAGPGPAPPVPEPETPQ
ncbi:AI-2E family transporter [Conexibacter sp. SYSU D00693]|uniref:AI-2E family transporter n=1 Tax=Conexibacter sp. SYSU D00693 TaxID=2812560 RepID=UPI00196A796E|nr:AI-2E family transporter [Conexibacter sp. SYSU D00693]